MTAVLVLQLVRDGLLGLDDPASAWLGDVAYADRTHPQPARARLRHALEPVGSWWERSRGTDLGGAGRRPRRGRGDLPGAAAVPLLQPRLRPARRGRGPRARRRLVGVRPDPDPPAARHEPHVVPAGRRGRPRPERAPLRRDARGRAGHRHRRDGAGRPGVGHAHRPRGLERLPAVRAPGRARRSRSCWRPPTRSPATATTRWATRTASASSSRRAARGCWSATPARCPASSPAASSTDRGVPARWCSPTPPPGWSPRTWSSACSTSSSAASPRSPRRGGRRPRCRSSSPTSSACGTGGTRRSCSRWTAAAWSRSARGRRSTPSACVDGRIVGLSGYHAGEELTVVRRPDGSVSHLDVATFVYTRTPYDPEAPIPGGHPGR